jgi:hypothetical protein
MRPSWSEKRRAETRTVYASSESLGRRFGAGEGREGWARAPEVRSRDGVGVDVAAQGMIGPV